MSCNPSKKSPQHLHVKPSNTGASLWQALLLPKSVMGHAVCLPHELTNFICKVSTMGQKQSQRRSQPLGMCHNSSSME